MILRGAIVSTERVVVRHEVPLQSPETAPVLVPAVAPPPAERPLDAGRVCDWIETQDAPTRRRIAQTLAEELDALYAAARVKGAEDGAREAAAKVSDESRAAIAQLEQIAATAEDVFARESSQLAELCADIVSEALAKIAGRALATREAALGIAQNLLARVKEGRELSLRVAEADVPFLTRHQAALDAAARGREVRIVADQRVELGGCIVESSLGSLDGRLQTQLGELFETLRAARATLGEGV